MTSIFIQPILATIASFGLMAACSGAERDSSSDDLEPATSSDMTTLESQVNLVLERFDELGEITSDASVPETIEKLSSIQSHIQELARLSALPSVRQTTPVPAQATRQITVQPSRATGTANEPPSQDEIDEMERGLAMTHLPGPPLEDVETELSIGERVYQEASAAKALLDTAIAALEDQRFDDAEAAREMAQRKIRTLCDLDLQE